MQCLNCCRKHIGKANAYLAQWLHGYPNDKWYCISELCHAEEHVLLIHPTLADSIYVVRKRIEDDEAVDLDELMIEACSLDEVFEEAGSLDEAGSFVDFLIKKYDWDCVYYNAWVRIISNGDIFQYEGPNTIEALSKVFGEEYTDYTKANDHESLAPRFVDYDATHFVSFLKGRYPDLMVSIKDNNILLDSDMQWVKYDDAYTIEALSEAFVSEYEMFVSKEEKSKGN